MKYMESSKNDTVNKAYGVRLMDAGISSKVWKYSYLQVTPPVEFTQLMCYIVSH